MSKNIRAKNKLPYGTIQITVGNKEVFNKIKGWTYGVKKQVLGNI